MSQKRKKSPNEIEQFKGWLAARGGEVLIPTNEYEVVRFRGDGVTSIIYRDAGGTFKSFTGRARAAWDAYKSGDNAFRITSRAVGIGQRAQKRSPIIRTILHRDGPRCFYCGIRFSDEVPPTKEHLVPVTAGGPDHISNIFLACSPCNRDAGHLSAPEKIRFRDIKRRGIGTILFTDLRPIIVAGAVNGAVPEFAALIERIDAFVYQTKGENNGTFDRIPSPKG